MGVTSAQTIINGAFDLIGVLQAGGTLDGNSLADGYRRLQNFTGTLAIQSKTIPTIGREVFPLIAGRGGPNDAGVVGGGPYTIGPNGNFNTSRPNALEGAGLLLAVAGNPLPLEIPRALITDDWWEGIAFKDLPNALFTGVYYNPTFSVGGLGTIYLYPVPNTNANSLVLYRREQLGKFTSLTASYTVPDGYDEMLEYNLAVRLAGPYRRQLPPYVQQMAVDSLALVKRANYRISDLPVDPALTNSRKGGYDIYKGNF
jgi:hypothetical protein